jgi:hypothetical protein
MLALQTWHVRQIYSIETTTTTTMLIHLNDQCAEPKAGSIMQSDESDDVSLTELLQWCQAYHFGSEGGCVSCIISGLAPAEVRTKRDPSRRLFQWPCATRALDQLQLQVEFG